jgi:hypothetical protein
MKSEPMLIPMQVGAELRIKQSGEVVMGNPEVELAEDQAAADAVLSYTFDKEAGEHILRLVNPVANHKHMKEHRQND